MIISRPTLKTYYETGKIPTQGQFANFIDSFLHKNEDVSLFDSLAYNPVKEYLTGMATVFNGILFIANIDAPSAPPSSGWTVVGSGAFLAKGGSDGLWGNFTGDGNLGATRFENVDGTGNVAHSRLETGAFGASNSIKAESAFGHFAEISLNAPIFFGLLDISASTEINLAAENIILNGSLGARIVNNLYLEGDVNTAEITANLLTQFRTLNLPDEDGTLVTTTGLGNYLPKGGSTGFEGNYFGDGFLAKTKIRNTGAFGAFAEIELGQNIPFDTYVAIEANSRISLKTSGDMTVQCNRILQKSPSTGFNASLSTDSLTSNRDYQYPDQSGTFALTSDIPAPLTWATLSGKPSRFEANWIINDFSSNNSIDADSRALIISSVLGARYLWATGIVRDNAGVTVQDQVNRSLKFATGIEAYSHAVGNHNDYAGLNSAWLAGRQLFGNLGWAGTYSFDWTDGNKFKGKWSFDDLTPTVTQTGYTGFGGTSTAVRTGLTNTSTTSDIVNFLRALSEDLKAKGIISI